MTQTIGRIVTAVLIGTAVLVTSLQDAAAASAKENFSWYCAQCHGATGNGKGINAVDGLPVGPMDLTASKEMTRFSNEQIIETLTHGGPVNTLESLMPPWGDRLTTDEIKELMLYVRGLCKDADCPK